MVLTASAFAKIDSNNTALIKNGRNTNTVAFHTRGARGSHIANMAITAVAQDVRDLVRYRKRAAITIKANKGTRPQRACGNKQRAANNKAAPPAKATTRRKPKGK